MPSKSFPSFAHYEAHFIKAAAVAPVMIRAYVREATELYFVEVKKTFGQRFFLKALASSTIAWRTKRGANIMGPTAPLVNTGSLRESVQKRVSGLTGQVGTNDPRMEWHERGSARFPPRPVFRKTLNNTLVATTVLRALVIPRILGES